MLPSFFTKPCSTPLSQAFCIKLGPNFFFPLRCFKLKGLPMRWYGGSFQLLITWSVMFSYFNIVLLHTWSILGVFFIIVYVNYKHHPNMCYYLHLKGFELKWEHPQSPPTLAISALWAHLGSIGAPTKLLGGHQFVGG